MTASGGEPREFAGVSVGSRLGEGGRSIVYESEHEGRPVALKIYKQAAMDKMQRKLRIDIAEFEYQRNREIFEIDGLNRYVAEPLTTLHEDGKSALVQERLNGELYFFYVRRHPNCGRAKLRDHLRRVVDTAHAAGFYDIDFHSLNVMVVEEPGGECVPKLFDFNLIPFHIRPPNPFWGAALKLGLMSPAWRDERRLRDFDLVHKGHLKILKECM